MKLNLTAALIAFQGLAIASAFSSPNIFHGNGLRRLGSLDAFAAVDVGAGREIGMVDQWAVNCGAQKMGGLQLTTQDGTKFHAVTLEPIQAGDLIMSIPQHMVLSTSKAKAEFRQHLEVAVERMARWGPAAGGDANKDLSLIYLVVKLLVEYEKGDRSDWLPWLSSTFNSIAATANSMSFADQQRFETMKGAMQRVFMLSPQTRSNEAILKLAFVVANTRSHHWTSEEKFIAPMADVFLGDDTLNHGAYRTTPEVNLVMDTQGNVNAFASRTLPAGSTLRAAASSASVIEDRLLFGMYDAINFGNMIAAQSSTTSELIMDTD